MLHLIPAPLHRLGLRLAHGARKRWWRVMRPSLSGVCVVATDAAGRIMLVRHSYGSRHWSFPGGALKPGEDAAFAALREFREEAGCGLDALRLLGVIDHRLHGARNSVHLFTGRVDGHPRPDGREILALRFFAADDLPVPLSPSVRERLRLLMAAEPR